ncbi:hypothetical protein O167_13115 [Listeria monocytogenes serotype 4bV str. LS642]|nr:hypothetical protein M644_05200 [Listeria monocytogenes]ERH76995.1 hypothetical protein O171_06290 [Listeria monocytogenes serotype 4bV str. LS645]ERH80618.1 hypothetical protein O167_13115 [Listeria monocytogenes serotype 4bV str. LS642]ERH83386.1 hypothetical protein O174_11390 [Listeria monocytogenes serotype 4bV str. LS644]ERH87348.1 hypothetical protein O168_12740 [Listeria monocytogenes serotype 4bV str. LS643]
MKYVAICFSLGSASNKRVSGTGWLLSQMVQFIFITSLLG